MILTSKEDKRPLQLWGFETLEPSNDQYPDQSLIQDFVEHCDQVIPDHINIFTDEGLTLIDHNITVFLQQLQNNFNKSESNEQP